MVNLISFLKTKSCCCGISLKTGSIAIVIANLIFSLYLIGSDFTRPHINGGNVFQHLIYLVVEIISLYGILQKKPNMLLAHLVLHVFFFVSITFLLIALIFAKSWIEKIIDDQSNQTKTNITILSPNGNQTVPKIRISNTYDSASSTLDGIYLYVLVTCVVLLLLEYHFFTVVFSYFLLLKIETSAGLPVA